MKSNKEKINPATKAACNQREWASFYVFLFLSFLTAEPVLIWGSTSCPKAE